MKITKFLVTAVVAGLGLGTISSCTQYREDQVAIRPFDQAPLEDLFKTQKNVQGILWGAYEGLQQYPQYMRTEALYSDDFDLSLQLLNNDRRQFLIPDFGIFNQVGRDLWSIAYTGIGQANLVIYCVDNKTFPADDATYNRMKGEALFIRGFLHFYLCNYFALPITAGANNPGIIIRTKYLNPDEAQVPVGRNTVGEVYSQVEKDLTDAIALLPIENGSLPGQWACKAMLARMYFNSEQYQKSYELSNEVITAGGFSFSDSTDARKDTAAVLRPFRNSGAGYLKNRGYIFQLVNQPNDDGSGALTGEFFNQTFDQTGFKLNNTSGGLLSQIIADSDTSRRVKYLLRRVSNLATSNKFRQGPVNVPVLRLAEMYLTRAEANVLKGSFNELEVLNDVNAIRNLNGLDSIAAGNTRESLLAAIRKERRMELFGEGDRWLEIRRLKLGVPKIYGTNSSLVVNYDDRKGLLKIPDSEVRANNRLEQN